MPKNRKALPDRITVRLGDLPPQVVKVLERSGNMSRTVREALLFYAGCLTAAEVIRAGPVAPPPGPPPDEDDAAFAVRIPAQTDHPFRFIPTTCSEGNRPPILGQSDHRFRFMPTTFGYLVGISGRFLGIAS